MTNSQYRVEGGGEVLLSLGQDIVGAEVQLTAIVTVAVLKSFSLCVHTIDHSAHRFVVVDEVLDGFMDDPQILGGAA